MEIFHGVVTLIHSGIVIENIGMSTNMCVWANYCKTTFICEQDIKATFATLTEFTFMNDHNHL